MLQKAPIYRRSKLLRFHVFNHLQRFLIAEPCINGNQLEIWHSGMSTPASPVPARRVLESITPPPTNCPVLRKRARRPNIPATRLAVAPMFRFCGRFLPLVVLLAGFPFLAFAQRAQSFSSAPSNRSSSNIMSAAKPVISRARAHLFGEDSILFAIDTSQSIVSKRHRNELG